MRRTVPLTMALALLALLVVSILAQAKPNDERGPPGHAQRESHDHRQADGPPKAAATHTPSRDDASDRGPSATGASHGREREAPAPASMQGASASALAPAPASTFSDTRLEERPGRDPTKGELPVAAADAGSSIFPPEAAPNAHASRTHGPQGLNQAARPSPLPAPRAHVGPPTIGPPPPPLPIKSFADNAYSRVAFRTSHPIDDLLDDLQVEEPVKDEAPKRGGSPTPLWPLFFGLGLSALQLVMVGRSPDGPKRQRPAPPIESLRAVPMPDETPAHETPLRADGELPVQRLNELGIHTMEDLWHADPDALAFWLNESSSRIRSWQAHPADPPTGPPQARPAPAQPAISLDDLRAKDASGPERLSGGVDDLT